MSSSPHLQDDIRHLPNRAGVYQFFDVSGRLLYIGKAVNVRSRVRSYFRASSNLSLAKQVMVGKISRVESIVVDTPAEALLLETTLIKKHKPPYNVVMKDDKNFQYIHITDEPYPRLLTTRRILHPRSSGQYFGPYPSSRAVKQTLRMLQSVFHYCSSPPQVVRGKVQFSKRPCLAYQLGRCVGVCTGKISKSAYRRLFKQIVRFLQGDYEPIVKQIQQKMQRASRRQQFEHAARLRDQLRAISTLMEEQKVISPRGDNLDLLSLARQDGEAAVNVFTVRRGKLVHQQVFFLQNAAEQSDQDALSAFGDQYYSVIQRPRKIFTSAERRRGKYRKLLLMGAANAEQALQARKDANERQEERQQQALQEIAALVGLPQAQLHRIEIYDISHFHGKETVGSMVVFIDGVAAPAEYRKFRIRFTGIDDVQSIHEVLERRLQHISSAQSEHWPKPDFLLIDGGKGQLSAAVRAVRQAGLQIPVMSIAKREEEIFLPGRRLVIRLSRHSPGLQLIQRMRDEAHRFAIGFYRRRHLQGLLDIT